jgi:hypothetical protein
VAEQAVLVPAAVQEAEVVTPRREGCLQVALVAVGPVAVQGSGCVFRRLSIYKIPKGKKEIQCQQ